MKSFATLESGILTLGNESFRREWRLTSEGPVCHSLRAFGKEWMRGTETPYSGDWSLSQKEDGGVLSVTLSGPKEYTFRLRDGIPGVSVTPHSEPRGKRKAEEAVSASGVEGNVSGEKSPVSGPEVWNALPFHGILQAYTLQDQTDIHDTLLQKNTFRIYQNEKQRFSGCLFALENTATGDGLVYLKHAPLPHARPEPSEYDFRFSGFALEYSEDVYSWTVLAYRGGEFGLTDVLSRFQRLEKPYRPGLDGLILSNTWGDRHRDMALNEAFLLNELRLASEIGVDVCQIDDGWQRGVTANSGLAARHGGGTWSAHYRKADPEFWTVHPTRFPNGFAPLCEACRKYGVGLGLWFSPDSGDEFEQWKEDSDVLLNWNKTCGVRWFKIDGVVAASRFGTARLQEFFHRTSELAGNGAAFDLDVTAGKRPGYFGLNFPGALFVENRYSDSHCWWPFATFKNLWNLSKVIPPMHLRMEVLNPDRNSDLYAGDPFAPSNYRMDWIFASVMLSSPLFWCELHGLSARRKAEVSGLIRLWKKHRTDLHTSTVYPVGREPDGRSWSGFFTSGENGVRHLLAFRDNSADDSCELELPESVSEFELLYGNGEIVSSGIRRVRVSLPERRSFAWFRVRD